MHAPIAGVDMHHLAVSTDIQWMSGEQCKAVFLEAARGGGKFLRVGLDEFEDGGLEHVIDLRTARLVQLALRRQTGDCGAGAGAVGQGSLGEDAGLREEFGIPRWWAEGVAEGEESIPC